MASCDKKLVKSKSGLRMVTVKDEFKSPFLISEPSWIDDGEVVLSIVSCAIMAVNQIKFCTGKILAYKKF